MGPGVASDQKPAMAAGPVVPILAMYTGWIVARIEVIGESFRWRRPTRVGAPWRCVAEVGKFLVAALAAIGTGNSHVRSVQVRLGALAFFVDHRARGKTIETERRVQDMGFVAGDHMREAPA